MTAESTQFNRCAWKFILSRSMACSDIFRPTPHIARGFPMLSDSRSPLISNGISRPSLVLACVSRVTLSPPSTLDMHLLSASISLAECISVMFIEEISSSEYPVMSLSLLFQKM